ncbi:serine hydrolase domain-containing protein [Rubripirellula reticaptiva]|uniref:Penicillin-binding protein 4 n=1 Tax=Rubripirellula reticaptiva TaxID=2528013 RepID=A0A5C6FCD8_9BACT|nr:serine hydrolase domain-containing protein [Rubripirellula reticaptiva]TWU57299.1 Penicillin-binding protein 4* [Rubripirellula reticaptiva]
MAILSCASSAAWADSASATKLLEEAIRSGQTAGVVVSMTLGSEMIYQVALGDAQTEPEPRPMTMDTLFDLASLTKPIATATSIMILADQDRVQLDEPAATYWPPFAIHGKDTITVRDLLLHRSGLIADNSLSDYSDDQSANWANIAQLRPTMPPGQTFRYSDVGFQVLGKLVEEVSDMPLDQFALQNIFAPLKMTRTRYNPSQQLGKQEAAQAAATEQRDGQWMVGEVHDPRAFRMGGVAGHAGLFSTAGDLIRFGQSFLKFSFPDHPAILRTATMAEMTKPTAVPKGIRGLGWDMRTAYSSNRAESFSDAAFGHGGFTGTVLWIDPAQQIVFVLLSNRLHPDGDGSVNRLAAQVADEILKP